MNAEPLTVGPNDDVRPAFQEYLVKEEPREIVIVKSGDLGLDGLAAVDLFGEGLRFRDLSAEQGRELCDDICHLPDADPGHEAGARFFDRVRDLTSGAFWTTTEGMQDLQYVGNVPLQRWDPPPAEVLRHLGL